MNNQKPSSMEDWSKFSFSNILKAAHGGVVGFYFLPFRTSRSLKMKSIQLQSNQKEDNSIQKLLIVNAVIQFTSAILIIQNDWHRKGLYHLPIDGAYHIFLATIWIHAGLSLRNYDEALLASGIYSNAILSSFELFRRILWEHTVGLLALSHTLISCCLAINCFFLRFQIAGNLGSSTAHENHLHARLLKTCFTSVKMLWPRNDLMMQICYCFPVVHMVFSRYLTIRAPQELGLIIESLNRDISKMPWRHIGLWAMYRFMNSWGGFRLFIHILKFRTQVYARCKIKDLIFCHVMNLSMDFHHNKATSDLIKTMNSAESLQKLLEYVADSALPSYIDLIVAVCWIPYYFGIYMLILLLPLGLLYVWVSVKFHRDCGINRRRYRKSERRVTNIWHECILNWETITNFDNIEHERQKYQKEVAGSDHIRSATAWSEFLAISIQSLLVTIALSGALVITAWQVKLGMASVGNIVTLLMYWETLVQRLSQASDTYRSFSIYVSDAENLLETLDIIPSVQITEHAVELPQSPSFKITFRHVGFSYDMKIRVLRNINFVASYGDTVAFVGETGGGKSTIFKLLMRHYDVTEGCIEINGYDLKNLTKRSIRNIIGIVPQHAILFNTTIIENVRYACLEASDDQVERVCKLAAMHERIMSFPEGYQTTVGERGIKLSGGELQRLAIARILLQNPPIIIFDEATSAIDSLTETRIQNALQLFGANRLTLVIAHRLSTIMAADLILVIEQGQIVERGTHHDLINQNGRYFQMWSKQLLDD